MKLLSIIILQLCCLCLIAQNGIIDTSFGFKYVQYSSQVRRVKALSDGRVLSCGTNDYSPPANAKIQYHSAAGALTTYSSFSRSSIFYACDTLPGGNAVGAAVSVDSPTHICFLTINGQSINYNMPSYLGLQEIDIFDLKLQPDRYMVLCGRCKRSGINQFFVARFTPLSLGSTGLDVSFGTDGITYLPFGTDAQARSLALQSTGKIIVAGHEINPDKYATLVRLRTNGTLDTSFNGGYGYIQKALSSPAAYWEYYTVSVDAQDMIYCGGTSSLGAVWTTFTPDGHSLYDNFNMGNDKAYFTSAISGRTLFEGGIDTEFGQNNNTLSCGRLISDPQSAASVLVDSTFRVARDLMVPSQKKTNAIYGSCFDKDGKLLLCGSYNGNGFVTRLILERHYNGVSELSAPFASSIYPNPTSGRLHIQTEERLTGIDIFSLTGQLIRRDAGQPTDIELTDLPEGSYIVALHSDKGETAYSRFIKANQ